MLNARTAKKWLLDGYASKASDADIVSKQIVAVSTAIDKAVAFGIDQDNIFGFWGKNIAPICFY